jgi:hypothetical protein
MTGLVMILELLAESNLQSVGMAAEVLEPLLIHHGGGFLQTMLLMLPWL